jgi:hypothetical protein
MPEQSANKTPVLTQRMTMHLNGGSEFSELHYAIFADGVDAGITRHTRTDGRPKYLITHDLFRCGEEEFDVLATRGVGAKEWILAHLPKKPGEPGEGR